MRSFLIVFGSACVGPRLVGVNRCGAVTSLKTKVIVVGAGPAGLMAAIAASQNGAAVTVCDQLDRPGTKLLVTGGGRCNLTNSLSRMAFIAKFGREGRFLLPALEMLDSDALRRFLRSRGVPTSSPDGFHIFPVSNRASEVLGALLRECEGGGVQFRLRTRVTGLALAAGSVSGVDTDQGPVPADRVVIATGGRGYPKLGATGTGYDLAVRAGHRLITPVPALVPLVTGEDWPGTCAGVALENARLWTDLPRLRGHVTDGPLLFTHRGFSGTAALDHSGAVSQLLLKRPSVPLALCVLPGTSTTAWKERFQAWQRSDGTSCIRNLLDRHLPRSLASAVSELAGAVGSVRAAHLTRPQQEALVRGLTALRVTVVGTAGFENAMVTRGGIALKEVRPDSLESRLVKGLYFAGEVLNLDGPCGGYNLQWAFSSGWLAGRSCSGAS